MGADLFPDILLKNDSYQSQAMLFIYSILNGMYFPPEYLAYSSLLLLSKKDTVAVDPMNTRPISILSPIWKIIEGCLLNKYEGNIWDGISLSQVGFRPLCNTQMHITSLQRQIAASRKSGSTFAVVFVDIMKAFDSINRKEICNILSTVMDKADIQLIKWFYTHSTIEYEGHTIHTNNGVPQGSMISPMLFNLALDRWIKSIEKRDMKVFAYADDMATLVNSQTQYSLLLNQLDSLYASFNLKVNKEKTEVMTFNWQSFDSKGIKVVNVYRYLGVLIHSEYNSQDRVKELQRRIVKYLGIFSNRLGGIDMHLKRKH